jgi:hypothetical protein
MEPMGKEVSRRQCVAATAKGAAMLAASALALSAGPAEADEGKNDGDTLYGHGMVWNRDLPGVAGDLKLSFDLRVNLETGKGFGTAEDPVHPDWNVHFAVDSLKAEKLRRGEVRYTMTGVVTRASNPANIGQTVAIIAETVGDTTAVAIRLGDLAFGGAGLVVIAIIAILIGMVLPITVAM